MILPNFQFYRTPQILFGPGQRSKLGSVARAFGKNALVISGARSLSESGEKEKLLAQIEQSGIEITEYQFSGEPSPEIVDDLVSKNLKREIDLVIAIGGGSVIDAGKAVSAMLTIGEKVTDYLEIVGTKTHPGTKIPFIAIPTTSGTGSEASANAVLSRTGTEGFKRSLRHPNFVPDVAIVDPELTIFCPPRITAACGLDALTQLLESYVSPKVSPFTDALVESALPLIRDNLLLAASGDGENIKVRSALAYASMVSGITLANAGLGVIHGIASAVGGFFPVPHGVICGTLLYSATKKNIEKLQSTDPESTALRKYARAGFFLSSSEESDTKSGLDLLYRELSALTSRLEIPPLSEYGITAADLDRIIRESGNKNNPVTLEDKEIGEILMERVVS